MSKPLLTMYPGAMQTYNSVVPSGTTTTVHALHRKYKYNYPLVTDVFEVEKLVYVDETARQKEIASRRYSWIGYELQIELTLAFLP